MTETVTRPAEPAGSAGPIARPPQPGEFSDPYSAA